MHLDKHDALFLLKNLLSMPRLTYLLRTSPCFDSPVLGEYDDLLLETLKQVLNCDISLNHWARATLPVAEGGLGIRSARDVSLPAFLSSVKSGVSVARRIYRQYVEDQCYHNALNTSIPYFKADPATTLG